MWNAPLGSPVPSVPAALVSSSVTDAGMLSTIQCQNPDPVGASGSKQVTAKLLVSAGKPDQDSDGEMFPPVMPQPSKTWFSFICSPCVTSSLCNSNEGTSGMKS